eukprot:5739528-Amphidinium_carterae.1
MGCVSLTWVKYFLADLGYSYRVHIRQSAPNIPELDARLHSEYLAKKVRYMQDVHEIPDSRVHNIDETSNGTLPLGEYGWAMKNMEAHAGLLKSWSPASLLDPFPMEL